MTSASVISPFFSPTSLVLLSTAMATFSPSFHFLMLARSFPHLLMQRFKIYTHRIWGLLPHPFPGCSLLPFAGILNLYTVLWRVATFISSLFLPALACFICVSLESETAIQVLAPKTGLLQQGKLFAPSFHGLFPNAAPVPHLDMAGTSFRVTNQLHLKYEVPGLETSCGHIQSNLHRKPPHCSGSPPSRFLLSTPMLMWLGVPWACNTPMLGKT